MFVGVGTSPPILIESAKYGTKTMTFGRRVQHPPERDTNQKMRRKAEMISQSRNLIAPNVGNHRSHKVA